MTDAELIERLRADMARATAGHHLDPAAVLTPGGDRPQPRRRTGWAVAATAAAVVAAAITLSLLISAPARKVPPADNGCGTVVARTLPIWARSGFSPGAYRARYVMGERRRILAVLFTPRLYSPPRSDVHNKVLWVARVGWTAPLVIHAHLAGSTRTVKRVLRNGPGPSYVNLPGSGCWQLSLRWGSTTDQLSLRYAEGPRPH